MSKNKIQFLHNLKHKKQMRLINDNLKLKNFDAWSGAIDTKETILDNGKEKDFDFLIEDLYPNGITQTQLNDILWHDAEWVYKNLNIREE
jgi:hypothetical protein